MALRTSKSRGRPLGLQDLMTAALTILARAVPAEAIEETGRALMQEADRAFHAANRSPWEMDEKLNGCSIAASHARWIFQQVAGLPISQQLDLRLLSLHS